MKIPDFSYKGHRKYVHGPDLFNTLYQACHDRYGLYPATAHLSIRQMFTHQINVLENRLPDQTLIGFFEATFPDGQIKYYLYESDKAVTQKRDYEENDIVLHAQLDPDQGWAMIRDYDRYSFTEISVALLKELCQSQIDGSVKWTMVDISYTSEVPLYTSETIKITLDKNIGTKMVVSSLYLNDHKVGRLKFSSK